MIKILIVDDDAQTSERLADFVSQYGHKAMVVNNPLKALSLIETEAPHIVLLDVYMPQASGLDILKQIKEKYGNTVKVIMITVADNEAGQQAQKLGADDFIRKPWSRTYLRETVMKKIEEVQGWRGKGSLDADIPRILAVDDEKEVIELLESFLNRIVKCELETATTGMAALELMLKNDYDLVLLDLRMPDLTGEAIIERVKKEKALPDILVVTGYTSIKTAGKLIQMGAVDCIPKPITLEAFKINVKKVLEKKGKYLEKGS